MRRDITVTNTHTVVSLVQYRTVRLVLDHASLVREKLSRADARDIRVVYNNSFRGVHVRYPNTSATEIYWSLGSTIAPLGSDGYELDFGVLDQNRDLYPVPIRDKSQWDLGGGTPGFKGSSNRDQPFALYDGFSDQLVGGILQPLETAPGTPSTALYDPAMTASWGQTSIGSVTAASGSGPLGLTWENFTPGTPVRVRGTALLQSGFVVPAAGVICKAGAGTPSGYVCGVGPAANSGLLGEMTAGSINSVTGAPLNRFVTDQIFSVESAYDGTNVLGTVDGVVIPSFADATHAAKTRAGLWTNTSGASGGIAFFEAWAEVWDGVPDTFVSVSVSDFTPQLPCPGLPGVAEVLNRPSVNTSSQEFSVVQTQSAGPQFLNSYELAWRIMDRSDWWELKALWQAQRGGAGDFSWTPPLGSEESYRFIPGSLETVKTSHTGYSARVSVERIRQ